MKRIVITRRGGPEVLQVVEEPAPTPGPGEVRLAVRAAGVAFGDVLMRYGANPTARPLPFTPGYDVVGTVEALGPGVTREWEGRRVAALTVTGGYAEQVCVPVEHLVRVPEAVPDAEAVAAVLNGATAHQMLHRVAGLRAGQSILVHGASGGVGTLLLQLARLSDVRVFGTTSVSKHALVRELGGIPIDYHAEDPVARVRAETGGGVDAVFDGIGGGHLWRSRAALRRGGLLVVYGIARAVRGGRRDRTFMARTLLAFAACKLLPGRRAATYVITDEHVRRPARLREDLQAVMDLLGSGQLKPVVGATLPLESAVEAHRLLEAGQVQGKLVLVASGGSSDR